MKNKDRVTLASLAEELGLTKMSVSRALKGARGVSEVTRERVCGLAQTRGYIPDAAMSSAISRMRNQHRPGRETLAWITSHGTVGGWKDNFMLSEMYRGASEQAKHLGYAMQEFCLNEPDMSPARLADLLNRRSIRGLVIAPLRVHGTIKEFPWEYFATVCCGYSLLAPNLHRVTSDLSQVVKVAWEKLLERGYRRIGLCVSKTDNDRVDNRWLGPHLGLQTSLTPRTAIPPLVTDEWDATTFLRWFDTYQPDVVLSFPEVHSWMRDSDSEPLNRCGFALLNFNQNDQLSGVDHRFKRHGTAAVSAVVSELKANRFGIPEARKHISIECSWQDGGKPLDQSSAPPVSPAQIDSEQPEHLVSR